MAAAPIIGGSANVTLNVATATTFALTGLDSLGQVVPELNAKIDGNGVVTSVTINLPTKESLNYRDITINIDTNDYTGDILLDPTDAPINGAPSTLITGAPAGVTYIVTFRNGANWSLLKLA